MENKKETNKWPVAELIQLGKSVEALHQAITREAARETACEDEAQTEAEVTNTKKRKADEITKSMSAHTNAAETEAEIGDDPDVATSHLPGTKDMRPLYLAANIAVLRRLGRTIEKLQGGDTTLDEFKEEWQILFEVSAALHSRYLKAVEEATNSATDSATTGEIGKEKEKEAKKEKEIENENNKENEKDNKKSHPLGRSRRPRKQRRLGPPVA